MQAKKEQMNKDKANKYLSRYKKARNTRANWDEHWFDVARYVIPNKENVYDFKTRSKGDKKNLRLYDSSARHYNELLASALHSMLTNPSVQWFELTTGDREIDANKDVMEYLQKTVRMIHQLLNNTNFQTEIHEVYLDLGCFGTGAMLIDEHEENIINFMSRPIYQFYIEENHNGEVDTFYIEIPYTGRQLVQKYGEKNIPEKVLKVIEKDESKEHNVIMVVCPNEEKDNSKKDASGMLYKSIHILDKECYILKEGGFQEFPAVFPRWIKDSMETYGRSPAMKSLPEIKMVNAMMRTIIRAAQKQVDPPLMIPDDGFMNFNIKPGGLNPYRSGTGNTDKVYPIETGGQIGLGLEMVRDTRDRIKESFFIDQLQLREGPQMTATEVNARTDEHLRLLGPILGRLHFELLQPLITRIIGIMKRKGELPPNPPEALQGITPQVFYSSQIARAQRIAEGNNWNRFLEPVMAMAQFKPEVLDNFDSDGAFKYLAGIYGAPTETMLDEDDVESLRESRAEATAQQESAAMENQEADTLQKTAGAAQLL